MFRGAVESWYSRADDSNPFFQDQSGDDLAYTSFCARILFQIYRFICIVILYLMLGWSALFIVLSLYGFAHFDTFARSIENCTNNADKSFRYHHSVRLSFLMAYGLSGTAFSLVATRAAKFSIVVKVCLIGLGFVMSLASLAGNIQELVWPISFDTSLGSCNNDVYVLWLYCGWPWYTATLLLFVIFAALKYVEKKYFITRVE